jgi:cytochrome c oxidase assembly protein subunit 15
LQTGVGAKKEQILKPLSTPYNRLLHRFAIFTACATFLLIAAGALVTSNDAGLSVPDWPTSFGSLYRMPPMIGGVKFEHGHRMFAEFIGLLTIVLAVWTTRADRRPWMRKLGWAALGTVIIQGVLGGLTVLNGLPPAVSTAHAAVGQAFFCIAVAIALFSGRRWSGEEPKAEVDARRPSLPGLAWLTVAAIYIQLILGGMFRHHGMKLLPHLLMAIVVAQLTLGVLAYLSRVIWHPNAESPAAFMVSVTVAHVSVGALVLATAVVLAIQSARYVTLPGGEHVPEAPRAITA